jgi:hypothetical protein
MAEDNVPRNSVPSDDQPSDRPPSDGTAHGNAVPATPPLDATAEYSPLDETAEHPSSPDQTQVVGPPTTDPAKDPPANQTRDAGPTATGVLPPVGDAEPPRWSARAQVPQHDVDEVDRGYGYSEWQQVEEEQQRRNLVTPALIALCVLLLLALIALGVWLSLRDRDTPPTTPTPSPVPTTVVPTTTSAPPPTTTPPAPTQAAEIAIPTVRGMSYAEAVAALNAAGFFQVERVNEVSELPEGQVIGTNPPAGNAVLPAATIEIRVSAGLPETTTVPPSTPAD